MVLGEPIFCGESALDQLAEIIKVLGTPTQEQILQMNNSSEEVKLPKIKAKPWNKVFPAIIEKNIKLFIRFWKMLNLYFWIFFLKSSFTTLRKD